MLSSIIVCGIGYITVKNVMDVIGTVIEAETEKRNEKKMIKF